VKSPFKVSFGSTALNTKLTKIENGRN
jgi:hypothetical protein